MSSISSRQNETAQIEKIAAARELYSAAKRRHAWQLLLNVVLPVLFGLVVLVIDKWSPFFALYGLAVLILDIGFIRPSIDSFRERATKIQELFDCYVLGLFESPLKAASNVSIEDILDHFHAHSRMSSNIEKLKNWYPKEADKLPLPLGRLICQRENLRWDTRQRERYAKGYQWVLFIVAILALAIGLSAEISFSNMVLILGGFTPLFQFCIDQYLEHLQACHKLREISQYAEVLWGDFLEKEISEAEKDRMGRDLQNEIFDHRSRNPLVFDWVYEKLRTKNEIILRASASKLIDDALGKINSRKII